MGIPVASSASETAASNATNPAMAKEMELAGPAPSAAMAGRMKIPAPIIVPPPSVIASTNPSVRSSWLSVM